MKNIVILGSTGSIGTQTLEVVRSGSCLSVAGLCANSNVELMEAQAREFQPEAVCLTDEQAAKTLKERLADTKIRVCSGMEGMLELAALPGADMVVCAVVGMIGVRPALAAIEAGKDLALANKETLVTAGHLIMPLSRRKGVRIYPVDSEHSAIFQSLQAGSAKELKRIWLTASGGPFRGRKKEELKDVTLEQALAHPNWSMGKKITVDSATLVNKGLEMMEAGWLFNVNKDRIQVLVHPQSILHSAVEFVDGAVIAQLGTPDMRLPIQYALTYPSRKPMKGNELDLTALSGLTFEEPDLEAFPGLRLGMEAMEEGGSMPTVYNAANEKAVELFLNGQIGFLDIPRLIGEAMDEADFVTLPTLEDILEIEKDTAAFVEKNT